MAETNPYTFLDVKRLKQKINKNKEINEKEKRKVHNYYKRKKELHRIRESNWTKKQLNMTEKLIHDLKVKQSG